MNCLQRSDDFEKHQRVFVNAFNRLVADGKATAEDFSNNGGWVRSISNPNHYFVYVGSATHVRQRYYVDVTTGEVFQ